MILEVSKVSVLSKVACVNRISPKMSRKKKEKNTFTTERTFISQTSYKTKNQHPN